MGEEEEEEEEEEEGSFDRLPLRLQPPLSSSPSLPPPFLEAQRKDTGSSERREGGRKKDWKEGKGGKDLKSLWHLKKGLAYYLVLW